MVDSSIPPLTLPLAKIDVKTSYVSGVLQAIVIKDPIYDLVLGPPHVYLGMPPSHSLTRASADTNARAGDRGDSPPIVRELKGR